MTLEDLHETIQLAFEWLGYHLHCFEARKVNGLSFGREYITIGYDDPEVGYDLKYDYNEREQKLSNWLVQEKDKLVYVYDFGDDWRHEIVLEKILEPEQGLDYPYCVKAMRASAMEDSGGFVDDAEEVSPKLLQEQINEYLSGLWEKEMDAESSEREETNIHSHLIGLAKKFSQLAPWQWLDDDQIFAVQLPKTGEFAYCSVMGGAGEEFGLSAFIGEEGLNFLLRVLKGSGLEHDDIIENRSFVLSFCDREELGPEDYHLIKQAGFNFRGRRQWPMFRSLVPGYHPFPLNQEEAEQFSIIMERVISVCERSEHQIEIKDDFAGRETVFAQVAGADGSWLDGMVKVELTVQKREPAALHIGDLELQRVKSGKKRLNASLEIGLFYTPSPVQEKPDDRPFYPKVFVVAERKREMIIFHDMIAQGDKVSQVQHAFVRFLGSLDGIPREIWVENHTHQLLKPVADRLGIKLFAADRLPIVEDVKASMFKFQPF